MQTINSNELSLLLDEALDSPAGREDPYPFLARLLEQADVVRRGDAEWYVLGYDIAMEVLRSPEYFKGGIHLSSQSRAFTPEQQAELTRTQPNNSGMLSSIDPPDHMRLRRFVMKAFTPRSVEELRPVTVDVFEGLIAEIDPAESTDIVARLTSRIPVRVLGAMLGLDPADYESFAELSRVHSRSRDSSASFEEALRGKQAERELHRYLEDLIDTRASDPGDDLLGRLIQQREEGNLTSDELVSLATLMYDGGLNTVQRMLTNGLVNFSRHPEQAAALRNDPSLATAATTEVLRYDNPVMSVAYRADAGTVLGDTALEVDGLVTVLLGAANRDPRAFESPHSFDVARRCTSQVLSFGHGAHYCLGAALTKIVGDTVFTRMVTRYPAMTLASEPRRVDSSRFRSFERADMVLAP